MKGSVTFEPGNVRPGGLIEYGGVCGWALALAHARSGDAATISGYLGKSDIFDDAVARFAVTYADQTERDHAALVEAVRTGRVVAEHDV
jgi:NAD(P)H-dependent flavin oxidoreductase YrpB (nitropropane dioxygenase family)